ncbi:hypothetical protein [Dyella agri]|uniref:Uncharacterized protein n=1 Tax=Dyella agri TaxID=1926869 RepID=A0ABW8KDS3_9GAMM
MREKFEVFIRFALLAMSVPAIGRPTALGVGMMFISVFFCDSGPLEKCARMGATMMMGYLLCAALPIPAVFTLLRYKKPLNAYMYIYPLLMLALAVVVYEKDIVALGLKRVSYEYGCLALAAFAYLAFHRMNARRGISADRTDPH